MKSIAISALIAATGAIQHHHHHRHPSANALLQDDPNCTTSQETGHCLLTHYEDEGKSAHDVDYFVPNFGQDEDIKAGLKFIKDAEIEHDHDWIIPQHVLDGKPAKTHPKDYFVPNFGIDHDIKANNENLAVAEAQLEHKLVIPKTTAVRENEDVPPAQMPANRVLDADVKISLANSEAAESSLDHKWNIVWN